MNHSSRWGFLPGHERRLQHHRIDWSEDLCLDRIVEHRGEATNHRDQHRRRCFSMLMGSFCSERCQQRCLKRNFNKRPVGALCLLLFLFHMFLALRLHAICVVVDEGAVNEQSKREREEMKNKRHRSFSTATRHEQVALTCIFWNEKKTSEEGRERSRKKERERNNKYKNRRDA